MMNTSGSIGVAVDELVHARGSIAWLLRLGAMCTALAGCGGRGASPGVDAGGTIVLTQPLVVSAATRTPIQTTWSVNYWQWMPAYVDALAGTETQVAPLHPAIMRVGGYNNDTNMPNPFDDAAFDKAVAYARAIGAEPLIQVPLLADDTGQPPAPSTAAAMVTYANVTKGYGVKYFSVGNEPDLYPDAGNLTNAAQPAIPGFTPAAYCTLVRPFVTAMRAADPTIQIVGPDLSYKYQAGNGDFDWLTPILSSCGELFDIVAIHRYPFEAKQATLAAAAGDAAAFKSVIASVRGILSSTGSGAKPLALTEMNVVYDATSCVLDASPGTVGSALWMASSVGTAIDSGLWTTAIWDIADADSYAFGLIGMPPAHTPRPSYYAYQLFAEHFGPSRIDVTSAPAGVTAYASRNQADDATEIIALNWGSSPAGLDIQITGLSKAPPTATFALPAVSMAAFHVPDTGAAAGWLYGEAQRRSASGLVPLAPGPRLASAGGTDGGASAAGRTPGMGCVAVDAAVMCPQVMLPTPAITAMGAMSGTALTFGSGINVWGSYAFAGAGQTAPTGSVTPDGNGLQITGGFVPPVPASANFAGFGLYFASSSCIDASAYTGIAFEFSGDLGGCGLLAGISFSSDDSSTNDPARGACMGSNAQCYGPTADVTAGALAATAASPAVRVPFTAFSGGMPNATADPSSIVGVQWALTAPSASADGGGCQASFTVENVAFYK